MVRNLRVQYGLHIYTNRYYSICNNIIIIVITITIIIITIIIIIKLFQKVEFDHPGERSPE